jgi:DNA topoisomerase-2
VGDTKLEVTELPVGYWTEDFKTRAEEIMDRHGPSEIRDVESHYTEKEVRFVIHFASKAVAQAWTAPSEEGGTRFETEFKMKTTRGLSTTNMHLYNAHGVIQKYDTVRDILNDFYEARLSCYVRRKAAQLARLREECVVLQAKIRFIMAIIEGELAVMNVPRQTLLDKLAEDEYPQVDKSYDYLVKMPIHALTLERKEDLMHECETKEKQIEDLENTTEKQMWEKELKAIESKL